MSELNIHSLIAIRVGEDCLGAVFAAMKVIIRYHRLFYFTGDMVDYDQNCQILRVDHLT